MKGPISGGSPFKQIPNGENWTLFLAMVLLFNNVTLPPFLLARLNSAISHYTLPYLCSFPSHIHFDVIIGGGGGVGGWGMVNLSLC